MAIRIPIPSVPQQPSQNGRFSAPAVTPVQDQRGQQVAGIGEGVERVGFQVSRIADFQQDQLDDARTTEADNLTSDELRKAQADWLSKIGRDATGDARKKADEELDKRIERIGQTLDNDVQRVQWKKMADRRRMNARAVMDGHETEQTFNYLKGTTKARQEAARIDGNKDLMLKASDDLSRMFGEDDTQRDQRRLAATTQFHEERIRLLAQQDPSNAARMLAEARAAKEIDPARLDELQKIVRVSDTDEKSLDLFRTIVEDPTRAGMPLAEQERIARAVVNFERDEKRVSADVYDRTVGRIEHHFEQARQARNQQRVETLNEVEKAFTQDKAATVDTLPAPLRQQIDELGLWGDASRAEAQERARRLAGQKFEDSLVEDNKNLETLRKRIEMLEKALVPEGTSEKAAQEFEEQRQKSLAYWSEVYTSLLLKPRDEVEVRTSWKPQQASAGKSVEDQMREAINSLRGVLGK